MFYDYCARPLSDNFVEYLCSVCTNKIEIVDSTIQQSISIRISSTENQYHLNLFCFFLDFVQKTYANLFLRFSINPFLIIIILSSKSNSSTEGIFFYNTVMYSYTSVVI
ncbi:hypothetical protein BpHYR1_052500 [Brachionus plicatilis]|uniref:Uncharacterized protein n=1 Tax=Brachionus plicatilis TaxID=10195 RepID=A0A3M7SX05_BRAPC|nr:hypothetical protein BpHYR1_052500 [Brachionus plicatilis]